MMKHVKSKTDRHVSLWIPITLAILLGSLSIPALAQQYYKICMLRNIGVLGVSCKNGANNMILWKKSKHVLNAWVYYTLDNPFKILQAGPGQPAGINQYEKNACNQYCLFVSINSASANSITDSDQSSIISQI